MNWHQKSGLQFTVTCSLLHFVRVVVYLGSSCGFCLVLFVVACGGFLFVLLVGLFCGIFVEGFF